MLRSILVAMVTGSFLFSATVANASFPSEQVWEAQIQNNQRVCGVEYKNGYAKGGILVKGETGTDNGKAITFKLKANTPQVSWKITDAKLIDNRTEYDFDENLSNISTKDKTSVFVNNQEYSWVEAKQEHTVAKQTEVKLVPKINMEQQDLPYGTTTMQGKLVVTCSNSTSAIL